MKKLLWLCCFVGTVQVLTAQSFEIIGLQDNYRGLIGETIKAPLRVKNNTNNTITLILKKVSSQIGGTQKNYFCLDNNCLDQRIEDYTFKIDPDQHFNLLQVVLEAGLAQGISTVKYTLINRHNPAETLDFDLNFLVEEKEEKQNIYSSSHIMLYDVYPNPVTDFAFVDYKVLNDQVKAKIIIHNILGNAIEEYPLPSTENKVKIRADVLNAGIYFYTLYLDSDGVITRKLIVKK
jgi:hypothetical protein